MRPTWCAHRLPPHEAKKGSMPSLFMFFFVRTKARRGLHLLWSRFRVCGRCKAPSNSPTGSAYRIVGGSKTLPQSQSWLCGRAYSLPFCLFIWGLHLSQTRKRLCGRCKPLPVHRLVHKSDGGGVEHTSTLPRTGSVEGPVPFLLCVFFAGV
jgi:hypothetical protein